MRWFENIVACGLSFKSTVALYGSLHLRKGRTISGITLSHTQYHRIISIAVLEHLTDLPGVVARSARLLAPAGHLKAAIPSEGGILWSLGWRGTTAIAYRLRTGLPYAPVMRHEHLNTAQEITSVVRYFFSDVRLRRFPLPIHHLSFYTALDATGPRLDRCQEFAR